MRQGLLLGLFTLGLGLCSLADESKPSFLDKLDAKKVPMPVRPTKGTSPEVLAVLGQRGDRVDCFAIRPDGRMIVISGPDQSLRNWDLDGLKLTATSKQPDSVVCLTFTPDGKSLVVGDASGGIRILERTDTRTPAVKATLAAHKDGPVWTVKVSPDGKLLASAGRDKAIRLWKITGAKSMLAATLNGHEDAPRAIAFTPDGSKLVSVAPRDREIRIWDITDDTAKAGEIVKLPGPAISVALSPDGANLATAGAKGVTRVWSFKSGKPDNPTDLDTAGRPVTSISYSPDGTLLVGLVAHSDTEDRIVVWTPDGTKKHEFVYDLHLHAVGFAPDGRHLFAVSEFGTYLIRIPKS